MLPSKWAKKEKNCLCPPRKADPKTMKLWLDDVRPCPVGWTWVKTADDCTKKLSEGHKDPTFAVEELSLDHDLSVEHYLAGESTGYMGEDTYSGCREKTGYDVCLWMAEHDIWPPLIRIHSASPVGRERMKGVIVRYAPETTALVMMMPGKGPTDT